MEERVPNCDHEAIGGLPPEQRTIHSRCYHPSGLFSALSQADIEQSVSDRFEQVVESYPDRIAVKTQSQSFTYLDLDRLANGVANEIARRDGQSEPVGVLCDNGYQLIAAILGAWKAGRCIALLDPTFPRDRIVAVLENSEANLVIADRQNLSLAVEVAGDRQLINIETVENTGGALVRLRRFIDPSAFACIVYTSGSTGEPKAVILNHRNMLHQASLFVAAYHLCIEDRIALLTAGTSNSVHNALLALVAGATLLPFDVRRNGVNRLAGWFAAENISICMMSSPLFRSLCEACTAESFPALRLLRLRSEAVYKSDFELYKKYLPRPCILAVGLASSETGLLRHGFYDHDSQISGNEVPVGYAVPEKDVWVEDADGRRLGFNEIGEIVVRSKYLSPGYWRRPALTEAKFKSDPEDAAKRICRTGDLGMMLVDGCLVHKGRKDFRVKVRGYRVELAEVEKALLEYPGVREAVVVVAKNKAGESRLAAYFTSQKNQRPAVTDLLCFLEQKLPKFMSPVIISLDALPLTRNGKVDRSALPALDGSRPDLTTEFLAPRNPTEERLAEIWADVLGLDCVGVADNFFELGGHSLSAMRVISRVFKTFQLELSINALFQSPTVEQMANVIRQNQNSLASQQYLSHVLNELEKLSDAEAKRIADAESREE